MKKIAVPDAAIISANYGEANPRDRRWHLTGELDFVGATGGRRGVLVTRTSVR